MNTLYHRPHISYQDRMKDLFKEIDKLIEVPDNARIYDAGASGGISSYELAEIFPRSTVFASDIEHIEDIREKYKGALDFEEWIEEIIKKDNTIKERVHFIQADMYEKVFQSNSFDLVLMSNNILNRVNKNVGIDNQSLATALKPSAEMLRENGYLIMYSNTSGYLPLQDARKALGRHSFIIFKKIDSKIVLVGDKKFYEYYSQFDINQLTEFADYLNLNI